MTTAWTSPERHRGDSVKYMWTMGWVGCATAIFGRACTDGSCRSYTCVWRNRWMDWPSDMMTGLLTSPAATTSRRVTATTKQGFLLKSGMSNRYWRTLVGSTGCAANLRQPGCTQVPQCHVSQWPAHSLRVETGLNSLYPRCVQAVQTAWVGFSVVSLDKECRGCRQARTVDLQNRAIEQRDGGGIYVDYKQNRQERKRGMQVAQALKTD